MAPPATPLPRCPQVLEELLRAGMSVARFNFSHGSHDYHQVRYAAGGANRRQSPMPNERRLRPQGTLDALREAMQNTRIMCATMLDTKVGAGRGGAGA